MGLHPTGFFRNPIEFWPILLIAFIASASTPATSSFIEGDFTAFISLSAPACGCVPIQKSNARRPCIDKTCDRAQIEAGQPVAIYAEGKEHATAVGLTRMSTEDIRTINKDIGVETLHYLNDGLWKTPSF